MAQWLKNRTAGVSPRREIENDREITSLSGHGGRVRYGSIISGARQPLQKCLKNYR